MIRVTAVDAGVEIDLKVVPGSSRERLVGEYDGRLKVAVSKPPEGGAANRAVIRLIARALDRPRNTIEIVSGHGSPRKRVRLSGLSLLDARASLEPLED